MTYWKRTYSPSVWALIISLAIVALCLLWLPYAAPSHSPFFRHDKVPWTISTTSAPILTVPFNYDPKYPMSVSMYVNGVRIEKKIFVHPGDQLTVDPISGDICATGQGSGGQYVICQ